MERGDIDVLVVASNEEETRGLRSIVNILRRYHEGERIDPSTGLSLEAMAIIRLIALFEHGGMT